ncbi:MAG: hypothetical protein L0154_11480 [Chloroflexi bacterium]|nr:hypothetical protein [Chloroflexota bacterium]
MAQHWNKLPIGVSGFIALVSCPCHLPVTLPIILTITAGTSLSVWISSHTLELAVISSIIFFFSLSLTFYLANMQDRVCRIPVDTQTKHEVIEVH